MKIRCTTNSIRLRLRKSDLKDLIDNGSCQEYIDFPNGTQFRYVLCLAAISEITGSFKESEISVIIPTSLAKQWANSDQVGLEQEIPLSNNQTLHILIEKDFPCKDRDEDISDTFHELDEGGFSC